MSNAKTGGNKKQASPSDQNYWKRAQAAKFAETHRDRRIAKHVKNNKTSLTKLRACNGLMEAVKYPHISVNKPKEHNIMQSTVPEYRTFDAHGNVTSRPKWIIKNGVTTDVVRVKA